MELQNKKVLVVGSGKSGIGAAHLLAKAGAVPVLFDSNEQLDRAELLKKTGNIKGLSLVLGTVPEELKKEIQTYVKKNTAPYKYPRIVVFCTELPKTVSGKIMRSKL